MTSKLDTAGLVERLLNWANEIDNDGTPSQVGPTPDDLRQWAEALTQAAAPDTLDALAQEIRRVDGDHSLGAAALAEALAPFLTSQLSALQDRAEKAERERDEALEWSGKWHAQCQAVAVILGLPEPDGIDHAEAVRSKFEAAEARVAELTAERDLLQEIIDSRPAINAGLPETYIKWSQAIYSGEFVRAALAHKGEGR